MPRHTTTPRLAVALFGITVLLAACTIVREEADGQTSRVDIASPVGALAARTGENTGNTGLPIYPGARLSQDGRDGDSERADVAIGTPWFGLNVAAAEYQSDDSAEQVLTFYREQMKPFGTVTECRGEVDFRNDRPVCRSQPTSDDVQLLAGTEARHRIVSVKPRGTGSEFALVAIQIGTRN
jgi:hypothetical protein